MILYTMMPNELIYPFDEEEELQNRLEININGIPVMVQQEGHEYRIVRVLSSDPKDFMDERFIPGTKISIHSSLLQ